MDCRLVSNDFVADDSVEAMGRSFTWVQKDSFVANEPLPMLVSDGSKSSVCIWYIIATSVS